MNRDDGAEGLQTQVSSVLAPERPRKLTLAEFKKLFSGHGLTPAVLRRASRMGIIEVRGLSVWVKSPRLMETGLELLRLGVPMGEMLDQLETLQETADTTAGRFIEVFARNMWEPFVASGLPADRVRPLGDSLERLTALAADAVDVVARDALRARAEAFLAEQTRHFDSATVESRLAPLARSAGLDLP